MTQSTIATILAAIGILGLMAIIAIIIVSLAQNNFVCYGIVIGAGLLACLVIGSVSGHKLGS